MIYITIDVKTKNIGVKKEKSAKQNIKINDYIISNSF